MFILIMVLIIIIIIIFVGARSVMFLKAFSSVLDFKIRLLSTKFENYSPGKRRQLNRDQSLGDDFYRRI